MEAPYLSQLQINGRSLAPCFMHFCHLNHLLQNTHLKKILGRQRLEDQVWGIHFPQVCLASRGVTMDFEGGGQAFPWVMFPHVLRGGGGRKRSFLNMLAAGHDASAF